MKSSKIIFSLLALSTSVVSALVDEPATTEKPETATDQAQANDFINFVNDDTLHGEFLGFTTSGKIIWNNLAAEKNIAFTPDQVRKIVINNGQLVKPFTHTSYLTLTNQDTVPGAIVGLDDTTITLKTDYAGEIKIPKDVISSVDFLPLGDKILYRGPYSKADWNVIPYDYNTTTKELDPEEKPAWELKNFSLKNLGESGVIMHKDDFSDEARYTFKINYRSTVMPSFVICADMEIPEAEKDADGKEKVATNRAAKITEVVGTSLIFRLSNYSSSLSFYGFDEDGNPFTQSLTNMLQSSRSNKSNQDSIMFDVRVNKKSNTVILYAEDTMIGQWDISGYTEKLKGNRMGFANLYTSSVNSSMISDIVVSSWNGILEPAASMENPDRDTILLTNGTDRYSGKALKLVDSKLQLKGAYADLEIPTSQIQSLYFASKNRRELPGKAESEVSLRFHGSGRLTGTLAKGPDGKIVLDSSVLGKLTIQSDFVSSYEFEDMDYAYEILK